MTVISDRRFVTCDNWVFASDNALALSAGTYLSGFGSILVLVGLSESAVVATQRALRFTRRASTVFGQRVEHFLVLVVRVGWPEDVRRGRLIAFVFAHAVDVVFQLDADLTLGGLIFHERMLEQLIRIWPLRVVLDERGLDERVKLFRPFLEEEVEEEEVDVNNNPAENNAINGRLVRTASFQGRRP